MFNLSSFMPKEQAFFDQMEELSGHAVTAADLLAQLMGSLPDADGRAKRIEDEERSADELARSFLCKLDDTFITPLDREDIHNLVIDLHGVIETISGLAQRFGLYDIQKIDNELVRQAGHLKQTVGLLNDVIRGLRKKDLKDVDPALKKLHDLEKQADAERRAFLGKLYAGKPDPLDVMKRREVQDLLETAIDRCERLSNVAQRVLLKNN